MKSMKKMISLILFVVLAAALITGCNTQTTAPDQEDEDQDVTGERSVTITDVSGDTVTITGEVEKIVNLWPAATASFFAMGAGDLIAGLAVGGPGVISSWTQFFYPESVNIPDLGGITPSIEDIINLEPDLVIIHPSTVEDGFAEQIREVGIPAINIYFSDYETMTESYTILGEILGGIYQEKLATWGAAVKVKQAEVRGLTAGVAAEDRPVVYYTTGSVDSMTSTMGANSIFSDWTESAGGIYAAGLLELTGNEVTTEALFELNPDVIICGGEHQHVTKNAMETTDGWKELNAVTGGRVYTNPYACFNWERFGLESQLQIHYALLCIQPEIAAAAGITRDSMIDEIIDFYKTYTDFELTKTQAEYMLDGLSPEGTAEIPVQ